jgi:hypothetical protein
MWMFHHPLPLPPSQNYDRAAFRVPEHFLPFQKFRDFSWEEGWKRSNIFATSCGKLSVGVDIVLNHRVLKLTI